MAFDEDSQQYGDVSSIADEEDVEVDAGHLDNLILRAEPSIKPTHNMYNQANSKEISLE
jgi:hypothetical protein